MFKKLKLIKKMSDAFRFKCFLFPVFKAKNLFLFNSYNFSNQAIKKQNWQLLQSHLNDIARKMPQENFSSLQIDAKNQISSTPSQILLTLQNYGYISMKNTGINSVDSLISFLDSLGMTKERSFEFGGRTSHTKQEKWVYSNRIRHLDHYPGKHYLLPNPECQYMAFSPQNIVFYCPTDFDPKKGGRTFVHSVKAIENYLSRNKLGRELLEKIKTYNLKIKTGFLEKDHPSKSKNYFKSIEEKFGSIGEKVMEMIKKGQVIEEFFEGDVLEKDGGKIFMASITIPGFRQYKGELYLNLPRIALTPPSIDNGFREYSLGNDSALSFDEKYLLLEAYLFTREEINWKKGDILIFNNITHVHSKESHTYDNWPIVVAMDGLVFSDLLSKEQKLSIIDKYQIKDIQMTFLNKQNHANRGLALSAKENDHPRYIMPNNEDMWQEIVPMRVFDAKEKILISHPERLMTLQKIFSEYKKYGVVHVVNTGAIDQFLNEQTLAELGFSQNEIFGWGGKISGRTYRKPLEKYGQYGFHSVDSYPSDKVLLPHNEVYYQHELSRRILFIYIQTLPEDKGGRTFFHSSYLVERFLANKGKEGQELLNDMRERGMCIESGFADENDPEASELYTRTWQDRFGTKNLEEALEILKKSPLQFDKGWVKEKKRKNNQIYHTLMTSITVPCFNMDEETLQSYLMFPRVAYNGPALENGYRTYRWGAKDGDQGKTLTKGQIQLLIDAYFETRLGSYQKTGDFIIVDNLRFTHSRESFDSSIPRCSGLLMAGKYTTEKFRKKPCN